MFPVWPQRQQQRPAPVGQARPSQPAVAWGTAWAARGGGINMFPPPAPRPQLAPARRQLPGTEATVTPDPREVH